MEKENNTRQGRISRKSLIHGLMLLLLAAAAVAVGGIGKAFLAGKFNSVESFQEYIAQFGTMGPVFLTLFQMFRVVLPVFPSFIGHAAGSVMFGPLVGFLCNYVGTSAGSILAFLLARKFGKPIIEDIFSGEKYQKWSARAAQSRSYSAFLFMAMVLPLFPDDFLCYLTGITRMNVKKFVWIIILGKPWCILAYSLGFSLIR